MIKFDRRTLLCVILLTFSWAIPAHAHIPNRDLLLPTLPQQKLDAQYQAIQQSFEQRATLFLKGRPFKSWHLNKSRADILTEFNQINEWRYHSWYVDPNSKVLISRADFLVAQDLIEKGLYRKPQTIAFQYNQTSGNYNSSTLVLNGFKFLALESPSQHNLRDFFLVIQNHRVTQLVRLSHEKDNAIAYFAGLLKIHPKTQEVLLRIPAKYHLSAYTPHYYAIDSFAHESGIDPKTLLKLIQKVRSEYDPNGLIACHSTHGAGRTGTFIAGFLLLNEIDRQLAKGVSKQSLEISIEKIVMQLSLQRPLLVRNVEQYLTLHRLVDLYISHST